MALVPLPNATGSNNFIRQPNVEDESDRYLVRVDMPLGNDNLFVRYIYSDRFRFVPGWFGGVLDGTSTSAWGRNFLDSHAVVGGWTKVLGATLVNEARVLVRARHQRRHAGSVRRRAAWRRSASAACPTIRASPAASSASTSTATSGSARRTSCRSSSTPSSCSTSNTLTWLRGTHQVKFGADVMVPMKQRVLRRRADARQPALPRPVHRQRLRRLPARLRAARRS